MRESVIMITIVILLVVYSAPIAKSDLELHTETSVVDVSSSLGISSFRIFGTDNFLGNFVRGISTVIIFDRLVDNTTGNPLSDVEIEVYVNSTQGDFSRYIGSFYTNDTGYFNISFVMPSDVPCGNTTITLHIPFQIPVGETYFYYWCYVFGRIFTQVELETQSIPLFRKNISVDLWVYLDNGTRLEISNLIFNVSIFKDLTSYTNFSATTNASGIYHFYFNFTEAGNYTIQADFWLNNSINSLSTPEFFIGSNQYIEDSVIYGEPLSRGIGHLKVLNASLIRLYFKTDSDLLSSLSTVRNDTAITIFGRYFDPSGNPVATNIILYVEDSFLYHTESNSSGYFTKVIIVNVSFQVGLYHISASDEYESSLDISDEIVLEVSSYVKLAAISLNKNYAETESPISIYGEIRDSLDNSPVSSHPIEVFLVYNTESGTVEEKIGETISEDDGTFQISVYMPSEVSAPNALLNISAKDFSFYIGNSSTEEVYIYNHIVSEIAVFSQKYIWVTHRGLSQALNASTVINLNNPTTLNFTIHIYDDFDRNIQNMDFSVNLNAKKIISDTLNEQGMALFALSVNTSSTISINIPDLSISISLQIVIQAGGSSTSPSGGFKIPFYLYIAIVVLPISILGGFFLIKRTKISLKAAERLPSWRSQINEILQKLEGKVPITGVLQIKDLIRTLNDSVGASWQEWMTTRELLYNMLGKFRLYSVRRILNEIVNIYEEIVFGNYPLTEEKITRLAELLRKLEKNLIEEFSPIEEERK
ncbi:MAG: DUF4129 domain-containing protein [Candidatus Njordarchaeia archaeon]|nr:DUF4129 domain-containing protein [Candidatus Korarchaeota archaeon]